MKNTIYWADLGVINYHDAYEIQSELRGRVINSGDDVYGYLLLLEHTPVITVGRFGDTGNLLTAEEVLKKKGIELYNTDRGGDYTYHGPGQIVCYPILNLVKFGIGVKKYVYGLEQIIINTLRNYGIYAERRHGYPGVWTGSKKIAFIGINIKRRVTMHGFSLNYGVDLDNYTYMNPCGIDGLQVTTIDKLYDGFLSANDIKKDLLSEFSRVFNCELVENRDLLL